MEYRKICPQKYRRGQVLGVLSILEMHRLMEAGLCGGGTKSVRIRPREGFSGSVATSDGMMAFHHRWRRADSTLSPKVEMLRNVKAGEC